MNFTRNFNLTINVFIPNIVHKNRENVYKLRNGYTNAYKKKSV